MNFQISKDMLITAQALVEGLPIIGADVIFDAYWNKQRMVNSIDVASAFFVDI